MNTSKIKTAFMREYLNASEADRRVLLQWIAAEPDEATQYYIRVAANIRAEDSRVYAHMCKHYIYNNSQADKGYTEDYLKCKEYLTNAANFLLG